MKAVDFLQLLKPNWPSWLKVGAKVSIANGPVWTVERTDGVNNEIHLTPPEGGPSCAWAFDRFLAVWTPCSEAPDRFNREDPI